MLHNTRNCTKAILSLHEMGDHFFLTGSKYFGHENPNSDWDFFVKWRKGIRQALTEKGFVYCNDPDYPTEISMDLMESKTYPNIQIQIISSDKEFRYKIVAQKLLKDNEFFIRCDDKETRKHFWETTIRTIRSTQAE